MGKRGKKAELASGLVVVSSVVLQQLQWSVFPATVSHIQPFSSAFCNNLGPVAVREYSGTRRTPVLLVRSYLFCGCWLLWRQSLRNASRCRELEAWWQYRYWRWWPLYSKAEFWGKSFTCVLQLLISCCQQKWIKKRSLQFLPLFWCECVRERHKAGMGRERQCCTGKGIYRLES